MAARASSASTARRLCAL